MGPASPHSSEPKITRTHIRLEVATTVEPRAGLVRAYVLDIADYAASANRLSDTGE
jgi:hypothetical protein